MLDGAGSGVAAVAEVLDVLDVLDDVVLDVLDDVVLDVLDVLDVVVIGAVVIGSVVIGAVVIGGVIMICLCDDVVGGPLVCGIWQFGHGAIGCSGAVLANPGFSVIADMATLAAIAAAPTTRFTHIPVGPLPGFGPDDLW